jgi:hypothetical protein
VLAEAVVATIMLPGRPTENNQGWDRVWVAGVVWIVLSSLFAVRHTSAICTDMTVNSVGEPAFMMAGSWHYKVWF